MACLGGNESVAPIHMIPDVVYITSLISSEKYGKLCARLASALAAATTLSALTKKLVGECSILLAQPHWQNNTENKPFFNLLIAKHQRYSPVEPTKYYISKETMWVHVDRNIKTSQELRKLPFTSYLESQFQMSDLFVLSE